MRSFEPNAESECDRLLSLALTNDPECPEVYQSLASFRISQCRPDDAKPFMLKTLQLIQPEEGEDPDSKAPYDVRLSTAKILMELGMFPEADQVLDGLLLEDDEVCDVWYLQAVCLSLMHDYRAALEHFQQAHDVGPRYFFLVVIRVDPSFSFFLIFSVSSMWL